ncbi:MAG: cupin domain-containing protein [Bacteroidales bacterium]|nr:cupin domain-containing protein [Bacteroidales bacterium]
MIKTDLKFGEVYPVDKFSVSDPQKVSFINLWSNDNGGVSVLTFQAGQELAEHLAPADIMVYVMDGEIEFTMNGVLHHIGKNEFLLMGYGVPHSVVAKANTKLMLIKIKGKEG